jgi:hypothetical protein
MSPRQTLTLLAGAAAALCLAAPVLAEEDGAAPAIEYAAPVTPKAPAESGKDEAEVTPSKRRMPSPSGCPFRQGDLDLIV